MILTMMMMTMLTTLMPTAPEGDGCRAFDSAADRLGKLNNAQQSDKTSHRGMQAANVHDVITNTQPRHQQRQKGGVASQDQRCEMRWGGQVLAPSSIAVYRSENC